MQNLQISLTDYGRFKFFLSLSFYITDNIIPTITQQTSLK